MLRSGLQHFYQQVPTDLSFVCLGRLLHLVVVLHVVARALADVLVGLVGNWNLVVALILYVDHGFVVTGVAAHAVPASRVGVGDDGWVDIVGCGLDGGLIHGRLGFDGGALGRRGWSGGLVRLGAVTGFIFIVILLGLLLTQSADVKKNGRTKATARPSFSLSNWEFATTLHIFTGLFLL